MRSRRAVLLAALTATAAVLMGQGRADAGLPPLPTTDSTYVVTSTGDASDSNTSDGVCSTGGGCTLRAAIQQASANCNPGISSTTIDFSIGTGPQTITPLQGPPPIKCPTYLDATTQPGYAGKPIITLDGSGVAPNLSDALNFNEFCSCGGAARGFVIHGWVGDGIGIGASNPVTIDNDYIGTDATGTTAMPNTHNGIIISAQGTGAPNLIGGTTAQERNVISGNVQDGVFMLPGTHGNVIEGNYIGTDATGTHAVGNQMDGVAVEGANQVIGGTAKGAGNLVSGNVREGISTLDPTGATGVTIEGNRIGTKADGVHALGNGRDGVLLQNSGTVGGTATRAANVIAFNGLDGVAVNNGLGESILSNAIHDNGTSGTAASIGIDLVGCSTCTGVTPNDPGDGDIGPNDRQNFPVLTSAAAGFGATAVTGTLNSTASTSFAVQFFASPACDPSGNGEGAQFLGSKTVTTVGNDASFTDAKLRAAAPGSVVTATATDPSGDTSEFSACSAVGGARADIGITNADSPDPVAAGQPLTYTLTVADHGPAGSTGVKVTDTLPSGVTFDSDSTSQGTCSGTAKVVCALGSLASGASATATIVVTPSTAGTLTDTATVKQNEFDPATGNDTAKATTTVTG